MAKSAILNTSIGLLFSIPGFVSVTAQQPNIVVIMADDLGYADVGFNGCLDIPTPNIDMLATQGVIFSSGYVSHSYCAPTRAGFLTGRYQHRFGFEANPDLSTVDVLPANQITIGNVLTNAGYKTILVGKWHLGGNNPNQPPNRGFTDFFGFLGGGSPYFLETNQFLRRNLSNVVETNYLTHAFTREAVSYINTNAANGNPFFLFLSYNAPHQTLTAPQDYMEKFTNIVDSTRQVYAAVVNAMDDGIGNVLQALDDNGIATNTLVVFLSDNGGPTAVTSALNTPLRGFKGNVFEGGVHVPFAARWPGRLPAGSIYTNPVISLDIFATAVALAGGVMPADRPMDSVNLMPYLLGETNGPPHEYLFWRQNGGEMWATRNGNWKWMNNPTNSGPLLVQLADDGTGEFTDLSTNEPARVAAMEAAFAHWDAQMLEPLFSDGQLIEINGAAALADNLGYMISNQTQNVLAFALTSPRYPPTTTSNFNLRFYMEMIELVGGKRNGYVVLGETNTTNALIRAGILRDESKLIITEAETGGNTELVLASDQLPVGTNEYNLSFNKSSNSLTLHLGTVSVTRVLSRVYNGFDYPGYAMSNASTRFSVIEISHTFSEGGAPTYEWDADAGADRDWSNGTNWTGGLEPTSLTPAYINGGFTAVVAQAGERTMSIYVGSTNNPSNAVNNIGHVEQSGGDLVVGSNMYLGKYAGGVGRYLLTNGSLTVSNTIFVGDQGLGSMIITNTGLLTAQNVVIGNAGEGLSVPGSRLTLGGGSLGVAGFLYIGGNDITNAGADGQYEQFGGSATVATTVRVANNQSSTGRLMVAGGSFDVLINLQLGNYFSSHGTMNISGLSTVRVSGVTTLGKNTASFGSLSMSGGLFLASAVMNVGEVASSTGIVTLTGGSMIFSNSQIRVGEQGVGTFDISGGSVTATTVLASFAPNGVGTIAVSGGRLVASHAGESLTLRRRSAMLNVSGGMVEANGIAVGTVSGHNVSAGPATLNLSGGTILGGRDNGDGASNDFVIASANVTGVVNITGGLLDLSRSNNDLMVGLASNSMGMLKISGGAVIMAGTLQAGDSSVANSFGYIELAGGAPVVQVGSLSISSRGELRSVFDGESIAPIISATAISLGGTLSISNTGEYAGGTYLIATSLNGTAVSGAFTATNWLDGVTGTVSYVDNRITISFNLLPVLVGVPADDDVECDQVPTPVLVTATNGCGELSDVEFTESTNAGYCVHSYELVRVWTVTNTCGFSVSATQVLSVADTTIPDIMCPDNVSIICEADADPSLTGFATAMDNCDASPVVSYVDTPGEGIISRTWSAVDVCSNVAICVQAITLNISTNDSDGDGMSDYDECVAGTSPTNDQSYLKLAIEPLPPGAVLSFTSQVSHTYTIEYQVDLTNNATWPVLTNLHGTGENVTVNDPTTAERRNYRLKANHH